MADDAEKIKDQKTAADANAASSDDAEESEPATLSIDTALQSFSSGEDDDLDDERPNSGYSEAA